MKLQSDKSLKVKNQESSNQNEKRKNKTKEQFRIKKRLPGIMGLVKGKFVFDEDALEEMHKEMMKDID